jgi:inner membrane transporter RhtA
LPIPRSCSSALVALLADVIAYSLQVEALSRLTGRLFSILTSTEPAAAALFGLIFFVQRITVWQWVGIAAVTAALIAAARERPRRSPPQP